MWRKNNKKKQVSQINADELAHHRRGFPTSFLMFLLAKVQPLKSKFSEFGHQIH